MLRGSSLLHVRGGVSISLVTTSFAQTVFSTYVEVFLSVMDTKQITWSLLHVRGGVSVPAVKYGRDHESSPRTWRCFWNYLMISGIVWVFSTHVEVFLYINRLPANFESLLHARGGVSMGQIFAHVNRESSPRTWRCFLCWYSSRVKHWVFSAHVEVFLYNSRKLRNFLGFLYVCGGDEVQSDFVICCFIRIM